MSNRSELAKKMATAFGLSASHGDHVLELITVVLKQHLHENSEVVLPKFGRIRVVTKGPRKARNPRTGEPVEVAQRDVLRFKAFPTALVIDQVVDTGPASE